MPTRKNIPSNTESFDKSCDFCKSSDLSPVYDVPDSALGVKIAVCNSCGLVQSIKTRTTKDNERVVTTSSGADWGNIRHGKGLRFKADLQFLKSIIPKDSVRTVLDVGSNRGDFVQWMHGNCPRVNIVAVEPDSSIVDTYRNLSGLTLHLKRVEQVRLPDEYFDLVYCSHTLEHAGSASSMISQVCSSMKSGGDLFLEIPNIEILNERNTVEEFFMDKHTFHFASGLLRGYLEYSGLKVINDRTDIYNITLHLKKAFSKPGAPFRRRDVEMINHIKELIKGYAQNLRSNRKKLREVVERIHLFTGRQKVAFWGAGRLYDALVKFGGLKKEAVSCLVDEHLYGIVKNIHGVEVKSPNYLKIAQPQVVIVLARSSADEISGKVRMLGVKNIIQFNDLFSAIS